MSEAKMEQNEDAVELLRIAHSRMGNTAFPALAARIARFLATQSQPPSPAPVAAADEHPFGCICVYCVARATDGPTPADQGIKEEPKAEGVRDTESSSRELGECEKCDGKGWYVWGPHGEQTQCLECYGRELAKGIVELLTDENLTLNTDEWIDAVEDHIQCATIERASNVWGKEGDAKLHIQNQLMSNAGANVQPVVPAQETDQGIKEEPSDSVKVTGQKELPAVGGRMLDCSNATFERRALIALKNEQEKRNPDNSLIALYCDAVRLTREYSDAMKVPIVAPPVSKEVSESDKEWTYRKATFLPMVRGDELFGWEINNLGEGIPALWVEFESTAKVLCQAHNSALRRAKEVSESADTARQYNELLMQVENKYPGETRHQTAMRLIHQAEHQNNPPASAMSAKG